MRNRVAHPALAVLALLAAPLAAQTYTDGPGLALAIADGTYNGTVGTMTCRTLVVPSGGGGGDVVSSLTLQIGMSHTWVGDLVIKLTAPNATTIGVLSRPGVAETADDGNDTAGFGDSSNLLLANPLTYDDAAVPSAETMGGTITTSQAVCADDATCAFKPARGAITGSSTFAAAFTGATKVGSWTLCVGDAGGGDTGTLDSWTLNITSTTPVELQRFAVD